MSHGHYCRFFAQCGCRDLCFPASPLSALLDAAWPRLSPTRGHPLPALGGGLLTLASPRKAALNRAMAVTTRFCRRRTPLSHFQCHILPRAINESFWGNSITLRGNFPVDTDKIAPSTTGHDGAQDGVKTPIGSLISHPCAVVESFMFVGTLFTRLRVP